jgi:hypothetical protein
MLEKWRTDCLPLIIENFNTFSDDLKKSLIDINHFTRIKSGVLATPQSNVSVMIIAFAHSFSAISAWEPRLTKT